MPGQNDLKARTKSFALRIIKVVDALPNTRSANVIGNQLLRSGTSVGGELSRGVPGAFHTGVCRQAGRRGRGSRRVRLLAGTAGGQRPHAREAVERIEKGGWRVGSDYSGLHQDGAQAKVMWNSE